MKAESIPPPAVYRLSFYLRQLEIFQRFNRHTISSKQLGEALGYTDAHQKYVVDFIRAHQFLELGD